MESCNAREIMQRVIRMLTTGHLKVSGQRMKQTKNLIENIGRIFVSYSFTGSASSSKHFENYSTIQKPFAMFAEG